MICEESSATTKLSSVLSLLSSSKYVYLTDALNIVSGFNVISWMFSHPSVRCSLFDILFILHLGHLWLQRPLTLKITVFSMCVSSNACIPKFK